MKKLKNILQYNDLYYILLIVSLLITVFCINNISKSIYNDKSTKVVCYIKDYTIKKDKVILYVKAKENLIINYYYKDIKEIENISYGDVIKVYGDFNKPKNNSNFNLFNYRKYLLSKKIKYIVNTDKIQTISKNKNIFYKIKNKLLKRINRCSYTKNYIITFIYADKSYIDEEIYQDYQKLGISHLLSVSGLHVSLVSLLLLKLLSFLDNKKYIFIICILIFYLFLTGFTISMTRATLEFILFSLNKIYKLNIKNTNIVIFLLSIFLIYNPFIIYNIGFIFSFTISYTLIRFNYLFDDKNIIYKLFLISLISFLTSLPIVINNFYQINLLSIIFNIFFVPYISYIVFPLSFLCLFFPIIDNINYIFIYFFENISILLSNINIFTINVSKIPNYIIVIYYYFLYKLFNNVNRKNIIIIIFLLVIILFNNYYLLNPKITFIDVNQGDSSLIRIKNKNVLIDTGGRYNFDISKNILLPYLKSEGVKKIDFLVLTHSDFDHAGEAIDLVNHFKVDNVIFNCGKYNDLEKELMEILDKKKIKYYTCIKELKIDKNKLYFLQTKEYDNENDNSNVIYTELDGYKFMFMGDASSITEHEILKKYNLPNIDVLKVGHHGSRTSSSKEFINTINPKYSVISVGNKNKYHHPNKETLENLKKSKIYRTDQNGSVMFKIKNSKLKIETCSQ